MGSIKNLRYSPFKVGEFEFMAVSVENYAKTLIYFKFNHVLKVLSEIQIRPFLGYYSSLNIN